MLLDNKQVQPKTVLPLISPIIFVRNGVIRIAKTDLDTCILKRYRFWCIEAQSFLVTCNCSLQIFSLLLLPFEVIGITQATLRFCVLKKICLWSKDRR